MKNLEKLKLEDFKHFNLSTSSLKSLLGGAVTSRSLGLPSDGADFSDQCGTTTYSDGSKSKEGGDTINLTTTSQNCQQLSGVEFPI
jgi:natural product precursor